LVVASSDDAVDSALASVDASVGVDPEDDESFPLDPQPATTNAARTATAMSSFLAGISLLASSELV